MSSEIDANTLVELRDGDLKAFNTVFRAYYNNVKYYTRDFVKSTEVAEGLTQEVFIKLWEIKERIDLEKNFSSFLFKIAHNLSLKYIKKKLKEDAFLAEVARDRESATTDDEYLNRELLQRIDKAVDELSDQKKKIYQMSVIDGESVEDIAEKLNINHRTVSNTLRLAINEIKEKIKVIIPFLPPII
jgi:RNA polymerase sigma-70 factor (ECF subfamily)